MIDVNFTISAGFIGILVLVFLVVVADEMSKEPTGKFILGLTSVVCMFVGAYHVAEFLYNTFKGVM